MAHLLLYGGTFDPVHNGHLICARAAREAVGAAGVLFIPAFISPHKRDVPGASGEDRRRMLELAVAGDARAGVDDRELRRGERGEASYTFDTVSELKREREGRDRFTLLLGADQLARLDGWHRIGELLAAVEVALMARPGVVMEEGLAMVRERMGSAVAERLRGSVVATPLVDVSATAVRERVRRGESIAELVPAGVAGYIAGRGLYR